MTPRLMRLIAIRAQLDALIADEGGDALVELSPEGCQHPADKRVPASNLGEAPSFFCQECKEIIQGAA